MIVNICYITDSAYLIPTITSISSLKLNKYSESKYIVSIIFSSLTKVELDLIKKFNDNNFKINLVKSDLHTKIKLKKLITTSVSSTSLLKFSIPNLLSKIDKVLYLDGDTIVQQDLTLFYSTNITNYLVASVNDGPKIKFFSKSGYLKKDYFNSGVMLLNLLEIRSNNLVNELIYFRENKKNNFMDQDSFNFVFKNRVLFLPLKYNFMLHLFSPRMYKIGLRNIFKFYGVEKFSSLFHQVNEAIIIHYTFDKPWKYYDLLCSEIWMKYYLLSNHNKDLDLSSYYGKLLNGSSFKLGKFLLYFPSLLLKNSQGQFRMKRKKLE